MNAAKRAPLITVENLKTYFETEEGTVRAVDDVSFVIPRGQTLGVVGESGCGKSVTALSIIRLVSHPGRIAGGRILLHEAPPNGSATAQATGAPSADGAPPRSDNSEIVDDKRASESPAAETTTVLTALPEPAMRKLRGGKISMIFQEPMTSLNPVFTIGAQIGEAVRLHQNVGPREARRRTIEMLRKVRIPEPERRIDEYPHQFSGGMRQRAMIAMALSCNPSLLIADEPTTALDVTTQAQILELLQRLQNEARMSILIITHDLGIVAEMADDVAVMYASKVVEYAPVDQLFARRAHPYTHMLFHSRPEMDKAKQDRLEMIPGMVPSPLRFPSGCKFHPRCPLRQPRCESEEPALREIWPGHSVRCHFAGEIDWSKMRPPAVETAPRAASESTTNTTAAKKNDTQANHRT